MNNIATFEDSKNMILVGVSVLCAEQIGKPHDFTGLVRELDGRISRNTISKALDMLSDSGLIVEKWTGDGEKARIAYFVSDEGRGMVEGWNRITVGV